MELVETPDFRSGKSWLEAHPEAVGFGAYMYSKQLMNAGLFTVI